MQCCTKCDPGHERWHSPACAHAVQAARQEPLSGSMANAGCRAPRGAARSCGRAWCRPAPSRLIIRARGRWKKGLGHTHRVGATGRCGEGSVLHAWHVECSDTYTGARSTSRPQWSEGDTSNSPLIFCFPTIFTAAGRRPRTSTKSMRLCRSVWALKVNPASSGASGERKRHASTKSPRTPSSSTWPVKNCSSSESGGALKSPTKTWGRGNDRQ
mmetsp:Transcript_14154/g.36118  ORF Transcript_14154/g.36118 Transcript_14154/m.36118 type:complete len:214 (+) Transcript_14154:153-794(+)